jgi:hypothetical protein
MTALRRTLAPALAAALLGLLGGCGSHHDDSGPQLHGAGSSQNEPSQAPMAVGGNPSGAAGGSVNGTPTPNAASHLEFGGGSAGTSTSTRATPDSGLGLVPGGAPGGGGMDIFPTAAPG